MTSTKNVLITGAMGFIGRRTARAFADAGHVVVGIGHGPDTNQHEDSIDYIETDVTFAALRSLRTVPDIIVHSAGGSSVGFAQENPASDFQRTVATTVDVLEFARKCSPVPRVVLPSSAAVYGDAETFPIKESAVLRPASTYGINKRIAEELCAGYARHYAVPAVVVRLFSVYGCGLRKQLLWDACRKMLAGDASFFGTGDEVRDWLHVDDVAALLVNLSALASIDCPVFNGGSGVAVSNRELLQHLAGELGFVSSVNFSGRHRPGDPQRYEADIQRTVASGWAPGIAWRQGIAEYAKWFKTNSA